MTNRKVILLTGASSGIGLAAAHRLLAAGHTLYVAARRMDRMQPLADAGAHLLHLDLADEQSIVQAVETIKNEQGSIDVIVNNAGYGYFGAVETVPIDEARRQFEVNLFGLARLTQCALPLMREKGAGRIVNVASMAAHFSEPHGAWYHATKAALHSLSECMRMEVKQFGIKVVLIEPGAIDTEWCPIAMKNLLQSSEGTAYDAQAHRHNALFGYAYSHFASSPECVAKAIVRASTASRPRLCYRPGFGATMFPLLKKLMPATLFDATVRRLFS